MDDSQIPENAIGYAAVVMESLDEFQGFFIVEDEALWPEANRMALTAITSGVNAIGALQGAIVEGLLTNNQHVVLTAALALQGITKERFFTITGTKVPGGIHTKGEPLRATTVAEARVEVGNLPAVQRIKAKLVRKMARKRKHH